MTDPIPLSVEDLDTISVSLYVREPVAKCGHDWANRTLWATLGNIGDRTSDTDGTSFRPIGFSWLWVAAVDVFDADVRGAVVVLGDSITDGAGSDFGSDTRWPDLLAERLLSLAAGDPRRRSVANAGIGGNTVGGLGTEVVGINAISRLDRDALSLSGVSEVIVSGGSNDLFLGADAEELIADLDSLAARIRFAGARPIVSTLVPRMGGYRWSPGAETRRRTVNDWIRAQSAFDAVVDFDGVLDDPESPGRMRSIWDADGTHPNSQGYRAMATAVDVDMFDAVPPSGLISPSMEGQET